MINKSDNILNIPLFSSKICDIKALSENFTQIVFYSNSNIWDDYLPGQFVRLKFEKKLIKCWIGSHHFGSDLPSIIIEKKLGNKLKKGDNLYLSKPEGSFRLLPVSNYKRSFIFLAQNEGIIPIYVMLQSLLFVENMSKASVYAVCNNNDALFYEEIDFLKNMVHGRISCELETNKKTFSTEKLIRLFEFSSKIYTPYFFVCGSKAFINKVAGFMLKKKIPIENLQYFKTPLN